MRLLSRFLLCSSIILTWDLSTVASGMRSSDNLVYKERQASPVMSPFLPESFLCVRAASLSILICYSSTALWPFYNSSYRWSMTSFNISPFFADSTSNKTLKRTYSCLKTPFSVRERARLFNSPFLKTTALVCIRRKKSVASASDFRPISTPVRWFGLHILRYLSEPFFEFC